MPTQKRHGAMKCQEKCRKSSIRAVLLGSLCLWRWSAATAQGFCGTERIWTGGCKNLKQYGESRSQRLAQVSDSDGKSNEPKYADDVMPDVTGAVRLYATHTLCISCLACCCQFKRLLPNVKLEVAFDVWRETRRWVGNGEEVLARFEAQEEEDAK
ncbi:unnamed protein product, partial [Effrenium voratum]